MNGNHDEKSAGGSEELVLDKCRKYCNIVAETRLNDVLRSKGDRQPRKAFYPRPRQQKCAFDTAKLMVVSADK